MARETAHLDHQTPTEHFAPALERLIEIDSDRAVAHITVGQITISSIWIIGIASGKARISWPETGRGHPIVSVAEPLKAEIETLILDGLQKPLGESHRRRRSPRSATPRKVVKAHQRAAEPDFDDPLDDLFRGGAG